VLAELHALERRVRPEEWARHAAAAAEMTFDDVVREALESSPVVTGEVR
jgi:hypothetical protein